MKHWMSLALIFVIVSTVWAAPRSNDVLEETIYQDYKHSIATKKTREMTPATGFTPYEQKLLVDAFWDLVDEGTPEAVDALDYIYSNNFVLTERLRIAILRLKHKKTPFTVPLVAELASDLKSPIAQKKIIFLIASYEKEFLKNGLSLIVTLAKKHPEYQRILDGEDAKVDITDAMINDLVYKTPDVTNYMNGEYIKSVKIFMFCRQNRLYPCLMIMKNSRGEIVKNTDGTIWTHKALASSAQGLPTYVRNGNTPTGIFTIDSVMPSPDQQLSFGKFRRMILNFIPQSKDEVLLKSLLPESSLVGEWWKSSTTARDIGRNLFRIHGTLKRNDNPAVPYYPFMRTLGCISQRENTYDGVTYQDQRELLDSIMKAMDLEVTYANESRIKGILYVTEIDDKATPVEASDLVTRGIQ
jgi:hypothetical protein